MINNDLFEKYAHIHPLIVHRTIEYLKNEKDIIYNLDRIPNRFPIVWNDLEKKWINKKCHN